MNKEHQEEGRLLFLIMKGVGLLLLWSVVYWKLEPFSVWLTYGLLGLPQEHHFSTALQFFVFETPKVLMLLILIVFVVGIIRSFFTPERTRQILSGKSESVGNVLAALLGIVTPFCSCSAVPLFIGFVTAGIPLGVTLSFLIPLKNPCLVDPRRGLADFIFSPVFSFLRSEPVPELN